MLPSSPPQVDILENGRSGSVVYRDSIDTLTFTWEFGGEDVVAIIQVQDTVAWKNRPTWSAVRREQVLRFVADALIRQKSPTSHAEIDTEAGAILLRQGSHPSPRSQPTVAFVHRYARLKSMMGIAVLVLAIAIGGVLWLKNQWFTIDPGKGTPIGFSVATDQHIATLIQTLEPYTPSLNRDASKDRYRLSLLLIPFDESEPKLIPIRRGLSSNSYNLAKVYGSDGRMVWFEAAGTGAVDLKTFKLQPETPPLRPPPQLERSKGLPLGPKVENHLAAGMFVGPNGWFGLHSNVEAERDFKPKSGVRQIVHAEETKQPRRFYRGTLGPIDPVSKYRHLEAIDSLGVEEYRNAAFLRTDETSEPIQLTAPDSTLMLYTSPLSSTTMVARVDYGGKILWTADTGIDRFHLQQILPSDKHIALVGTKPPVPDRLSEPLLVLIEKQTGKISSHTLWR